MLVNKKEYSLDEIKDFLKKSNSKQEFAYCFKFTYLNGKIYKIIDKLIASNNLDNSHFDRYLSNRIRAKYEVAEKNCPICQIKFTTKLGHKNEKVTCGSKCSNTYFAASKHTELSNLKRSLKLTKLEKKYKREKVKRADSPKATIKLYCINCEMCRTIFYSRKSKSRFCSQKCISKNSWKLPGFRENLIAKAKERVATGNHKGWNTRSKITPSFPEKVTKEIIDELGITNLIKEYKCGKWFIDFADIDNKIALEIDGKQHEMPERKASDEAKDTYLQSNGWKVFRIKWQYLTKEFRESLKNKIKEIFS